MARAKKNGKRTASGKLSRATGKQVRSGASRIIADSYPWEVWRKPLTDGTEFAEATEDGRIIMASGVGSVKRDEDARAKAALLEEARKIHERDDIEVFCDMRAGVGGGLLRQWQAKKQPGGAWIAKPLPL